VITIALPLLVLALVLVAVLLVAVVARTRFPRVTVREYERGLKYVRGRFAGVVEPGAFRIDAATTQVRKVDMRLAHIVLPGQEVLSADGVTLRLSLGGTWRMTDPATAVNEVQDYLQALYLTVQLAVRRVIGAAPIDDTLERRAELGGRVLQLAAPEVAGLGLELVSLDLRDSCSPAT
jgi:regulator of protease activity HflC (stomatin/prohibitin superfamily)